MTIYENMQAMAKCLAKDPETKDRYDKATHGGKEWFCFSRWIKGNMARWNDAEAVEYRDALVGRLISTDIAYVLQYETAPDVVAYLKGELIATVGRETSPERLAKRGDWTANARMRWRHITANPPPGGRELDRSQDSDWHVLLLEDAANQRGAVKGAGHKTAL